MLAFSFRAPIVSFKSILLVCLLLLSVCYMTAKCRVSFFPSFFISTHDECRPKYEEVGILSSSFSLSFHRLLILKKTPNWSFSFHSIFSPVLNIFLILYLLSNRIESIRFLFTSFCIRTEEDIFARDFSYSILPLLCLVDPRRSGWLFSYPTTGESIFPIIGKSVRLPCVLYNALR